MKILSVDYGSKRVGVASGDSVNKIAFPKTVINNKGEDYVIGEILRICEEDGYEMVVFGLPLDMNDQKGEQYKIVENFVNRFKQGALGRLKVEVVDERLSSFEADQYLGDFKGAKVRKKDGDRDMLAAKVILERWFDLG